MKIRAIEKAPVIATTHAIPATVDEFTLLARHYPIIFAVGDSPVPLALMGLTDFADAWPKMLSGGMRQRLALARAYAVRPQFLLMDEPFGALDAQTRTAMQDLLLQVLATEGKTVMLITHSVEEAIYLASRIVVMSARPTRIREEIRVPFTYPRTESLHETREFNELRSHVRDLVMQEYAAQAEQAAHSIEQAPTRT